jgi:hypothetical protein
VALAREFADLVNALPRILGSLEPLDALCLGFLLLAHKKLALNNKKPTNQCFWRVGLENLKLD